MARRSEPYRRGAPAVAELAAGAVVLLEPAGRVLLLHETAEDRWGLPKGHLEPGESAEEAAHRESREETGLEDLRIGPEIAQVHYRFYEPRTRRNVVKTTTYFLARTQRSEVSPERIFDRFAWVTLGEALRRVRYATDRRVLRAAQRLLRKEKGKG